MRVVYAGHVGQKTGFGRAAVENCRALLRAGVDLRVIALGVDADLPSDLRGAYEKTFRDADALIVHTLPLDCRKACDLLTQHGGFEARKEVAYTTWETLTAPNDVVIALAEFDEVWTPSRSSSGALCIGRGSTDVYVVPHCYDGIDRSHHGERPGHPAPSGRVRFYWIGAWTTRKNPHGVIRAFAHCFSRDDDVELVMHSPGADKVQCYAALAQTGLDQTQLPPIMFSTEFLDDEAIWNMHAQGDVFVSASRGEAWNLPAFEAMLCRKWVIVTAEQGSDDFLYWPENDIETNAIRITSRADIAHVTVRAQQQAGGNQVGFVTVGAQGLTSKVLWQEPDLLPLSLEMHHARSIVRRGRALHVGYNPRDRFGYEAVAKIMMERIAS